MARKQRTWNYGPAWDDYGTAPAKLHKGKERARKYKVSKENIQMGDIDYLIHSQESSKKPLAKIGADFGTEVARIIETPEEDPRIHGVYYPKGLSRNRDMYEYSGQSPYKSDVTFARKAYQLPGAIVTDTEGMAGVGSYYFGELNEPRDWQRTYGSREYPSLRSQWYKKGTGYQAISKTKDVIGLVPRQRTAFKNVPEVEDMPLYRLAPEHYGQLESGPPNKDAYWSHEKSRDYTKGKKIYTKRLTTGLSKKEYFRLQNTMKRLDTLDHELMHRGFDKWHKILKSNPALKERLRIKYEDNPRVLHTLMYGHDAKGSHPYIYAKSPDPWDRKYLSQGMTRDVVQMIEQEILPYFFERMPSLKKADALQGPAYGDVKGRGTIMKKRKYQTKKKRGTASYGTQSVKFRGKDLHFKIKHPGTWNY